MQAAHRQALQSAGADESPAKLLNFLRWRALRIAGPLREIAQHTAVGPLPLAAAHTAEGLQLLLGVCASGQDLAHLSPQELQAALAKAKAALADALVNLERFLDLVNQVNDLL